MVERVLRAVSRPHREQVMIVVLEAAAATNGDEPRIPDLGEDHQSGHLAPLSAKGSPSESAADPHSYGPSVALHRQA